MIDIQAVLVAFLFFAFCKMKMLCGRRREKSDAKFFLKGEKHARLLMY